MDLSNLRATLIDNLGEGLPTIFAALVILLVGYFIAKLLQRIAYKLLNKTGLDNRIAANAGSTMKPERAISKIVYYVVMVIVLVMAMETLGLTQILDPLNDMVSQFLGFIPNLVAAGLIGFIGYVIAKIASSLVGMAAGFLENLGKRAGLSAEINLTSILTNVVFIVVFIPILIAALDALKMTTITDPLKDMLAMFISSIPRIIAAVLIIGLFYIGGKFVTGLLQQLLASLGMDNMADKLQLNAVIGEGTSLSKLLANVAFFFLMFLGVITGMERLEFTQLNQILSQIFEMTGQIAFGLVILALGNYLANLAYTTMSSGRSDTFIASLARIVILGLFLAIALRTMGIADDIVNLAFGLTLGAVAVAVALSFGLGGREAAGEQMKRILDKFNNDSSTK
ncbi:mechanosensitive ion channel [Neolewinella agarilytica]|uniref:Conserved TM helix n=1 Tax=Neolewinella agarilytica TaxID=478744 RepID=A0A1H9BLR3_9BACT|nr:mechanosensitive ion channel [Neolewinella agarilytica]SEP89835.1 Conserved TM helix [Neolewinella agarilytica]